MARRGFKYSVATGTPVLTVEVNDARRVTMDATGICFLAATTPVAAATITGDISGYVEATFKQVLTQLAALGLLTDSTTS